MLADVIDTCPLCRRPGSAPYRTVRESDSQLRVLLRCDGCRHRWATLIAEESLTAEAKAFLLRQSTARL
jgi:hypothetical protein